jgi:hypothetical protein
LAGVIGNNVTGAILHEHGGWDQVFIPIVSLYCVAELVFVLLLRTDTTWR